MGAPGSRQIGSGQGIQANVQATGTCASRAFGGVALLRRDWAGVKIFALAGIGCFIATFITSRFFAERSGRAALDLAAERASETCTHLGGFPQPIRAIPQWLLAKYDDVIRGTQRTGT